jgi:hypothetical protein
MGFKLAEATNACRIRRTRGEIFRVRLRLGGLDFFLAGVFDVAEDGTAA